MRTDDAEENKRIEDTSIARRAWCVFCFNVNTPRSVIYRKF